MDEIARAAYDAYMSGRTDDLPWPLLTLDEQERWYSVAHDVSRELEACACECEPCLACQDKS